jgi:hypothetical protein
LSKLTLALTALLLTLPIAAFSQQGFGTGVGFGQSSSPVSQVNILVGDVGGVADTQNPNDSDEDGVFDDPIICADKCFFKAQEDKGGSWWSAVETDGATDTVWSPQNEERMAHFTFEPVTSTAGAWTSDAWDTGGCIVPSRAVTDRDAVTACAGPSYSLQYFGRAFLTRMVWVASEANTNGVSCDLRMAEYGGTVAVANTTLTIGLTVLAPEDLLMQYVGTEIVEGVYNFQARNGGGGTGCVDGATCECVSGVAGVAQFYGIPMQ